VRRGPRRPGGVWELGWPADRLFAPVYRFPRLPPIPGRKATAVADHALLREFERKRSSRWQCLARLLKPRP